MNKPPKQKKEKMTAREKAVVQKAQTHYSRGVANKTKGVTDKKLKSSIKSMEEKYKAAALAATRAELLYPSEAG